MHAAATMRRLFALWFTLLALLGLAGCKPVAIEIANLAPTATVTPFSPATNTFIPPTATLTPTPSVSPTPTLTPTPLASPTPAPPPRPQYTLHAHLNYWQRQADVEEHIIYPNTADTPLDTLVLNVEPAQWSNAFELGDATINGQPIRGALKGTYWQINLSTPIQPGQSASLDIHYRLHLPYQNAARIFGASAQQVNLTEWYPFVVPYDAKDGWLWHQPWPFGDHLAYAASDFDVTLEITNAPQDITVAASALPDKDGHYRLEAARSFVFSISPAFHTTQSEVNGITITSYYFDDIATGGKILPTYAAKAVATFTQHYGPLPRKHLAIVATTSADGMEYSGLVFLSRSFYESYEQNYRGTVLNNLISLGVHELSHQWWYDQVGNDQAINPWMDEALATYSEWIFYHDNYPANAPMWWNFRVLYFRPEGFINGSIYDYPTFRPYVNAVYLRGAQFIDALRQRMGDEAFYAFLKDYQTQMRGSIARPNDFFRILNAHTNDDYSDLLKIYFGTQEGH